MRQSRMCAAIHALFLAGLLIPAAWATQEPRDGSAVNADQRPAVLTLAGDGLTVRVFEVSADGTQVRGELVLDGKTFPFRGHIEQVGDVERVTGTFIAEGEEFSYTSEQVGDEPKVTFRSGGATYVLQQAEAGRTPAPAAGAEPVNPLSKTAPRVDSRSSVPQSGGSKVLPAQIRLKRVEFRDISMGNVVSHTMLVPEGWKSTGHVEWSTGTAPYPQTRIRVESPDGSSVSFVPALHFAYTEVDPNWLAQMDQMGMQHNLKPRDGTPPPQDLGQWLVSYLAQNNQSVRDVRLVDQKRDDKAEQAMQKLLPGSMDHSQMHVVTIAYVKGGVPFREEINLTLQRFPPIEGPSARTWMWNLFVSGVVAAPEKQFDQVRPLLYTLGNSLQPTPQWFAQKQQLLAEFSRQKHESNMAAIKAQGEAIRRRGEMYSQISDAQHESWKRQQAINDDIQRQRINAIRDEDDFGLPSGGSVKLPSLYNNVYQTEKGDFILSNAILDGPGLTKLEPVK